MSDACLIPSLDAGTQVTPINIDRTSLGLSDLRILVMMANSTNVTNNLPAMAYTAASTSAIALDKVFQYLTYPFTP